MCNIASSCNLYNLLLLGQKGGWRLFPHNQTLLLVCSAHSQHTRVMAAPTVTALRTQRQIIVVDVQEKAAVQANASAHRFTFSPKEMSQATLTWFQKSSYQHQSLNDHHGKTASTGNAQCKLKSAETRSENSRKKEEERKCLPVDKVIKARLLRT